MAQIALIPDRPALDDRAVSLAQFVVGVMISGLAAVLLASVGIGILASAFGAETFTIRGRSMEPAIPVGSVIVVKRADEIRTGDTITYRAASGVAVTHRVLGFTEVDGSRQLLTQGDANANRDPAPIEPEAVAGTVVLTIPALGYVLWLLSNPPGVLGIVAAFLALLAAMWLLDDLARQKPLRPVPAAP